MMVSAYMSSSCKPHRRWTTLAILLASAMPAAAQSDAAPRTLDQLIQPTPAPTAAQPQPETSDGQVFDPNADIVILDEKGATSPAALEEIRDSLRRLNEAAEALKASQAELPGRE